MSRRNESVLGVLSQQYVTYAQFGVNGQKKYYNPSNGNYYLDAGFTQQYTVDDGVLIQAAHNYANTHNLPVKNTHGEYVILGTSNIQVQTNVDWGNSVFHVDESKRPVTNGQPFTVSSIYTPTNIDSSQFSTILPYLVRGTTTIPPLASYRNHFVIVQDTTTHVGIRYMSDNTPNGDYWPMTAMFYVDEGGKIVGDITFNFTNITSIQVVQCDENYLDVSGGVFLLNGDLTYTSSSTEYKNNGLYINRSRVRIKDQYCGFEDNATDKATASSGGVYSYYQCFDVSLENCKAMPRKSGSQGTYGIVANQVLNWRMKNVTAQGDHTYWGVLGNNMVKDWHVSDCVLDIIDGHFHMWNVDIQNTTIGDYGIVISGGGRLNLKNVRAEGVNFCTIRADYGSIWDGDINIEDCRLLVNDSNATDPTPNILTFFPYQGNYGQQVIFGRRITVKNFVFDFTQKPSNTNPAWLARFSSFTSLSNARPVFPSFMEFKNVSVVGRTIGCTFFSITNPHAVQTDNQCAYTIAASDIDIVPNAVYKFDSIYTSEIVGNAADSGNFHFFLGAQNNSTYTDNYAVVPKVVVSNCEHVSAQPKGSIAKIVFDKCSINTIDSYGNYGGQSKIDFLNCEFRPNMSATTNLAYLLTNDELTFVNCKVYPLKVNGTADLQNTIKGKLGFFGEDGTSLFVLGTHTGTKLNEAIINYMNSNSAYVSRIPAYLDELAASQHHYYSGTYHIVPHYGQATIAASGTSVTVTHGLGFTPSNVFCTAQGNVGNVWVTQITSTYFVINCATAPAANTVVSWFAEQ